MDIDGIRKAHIEMHGLARADAEYTFYHDETNNIKKLRLSAQGLNVAEPNVFVLGGIVHEGTLRTLDIHALRNAMRIQTSADEIKLKHVAKGEFLDLIKSDKLTTYLQWIISNKLLIQYQALDPLYWSLVDIIDSIISGLSQPRLMEFHLLLKGDLATLLRGNLPATTDLFYRYNYPDLAPKDRKPFFDELIALLVQSDGVMPEFNAMMLKGMLQSARTLPSLDFIEGFTPHVLIDSFREFYLTRIAIFKYSDHVLDMEDSIRDGLEELSLTANGEPVQNYRFADSKTEPGIQLADVAVGLLGKMYSYFVRTPRNEVEAVRASLRGTSQKNAELLRDLMDAAHDANIAFLNQVISIHDMDKMNMFFRLRGSEYE